MNQGAGQHIDTQNTYHTVMPSRLPAHDTPTVPSMCQCFICCLARAKPQQQEHRSSWTISWRLCQETSSRLEHGALNQTQGSKFGEQDEVQAGLDFPRITIKAQIETNLL